MDGRGFIASLKADVGPKSRTGSDDCVPEATDQSE
jgi:hypothetical protein